MGERLPGELHERLRELREEHGYSSRAKLADVLGMDRTTYGRMESGETKTVSSDVLVKLARLYHVTTDYVLGLTDVPEDTFYDLSEMGLSVEAAKSLYSKKADPRVVNELLTNDRFALATRMMATYFSGAVAQALADHNALLEFAYGLISEQQDLGNLPKAKELTELKKELRAKQVPAERFELSKIEAQLMAAVREIRRKCAEEIREADLGREVLSSEIAQSVREEIGRLEDLKNLGEEEKRKRVTEGIRRALTRAPGIGEAELPALTKLADQAAPVLMDLWKRE